MVRKVLYPAVFVLVVAIASAAYATWKFESVFTIAYDPAPDGRFYDETGLSLLDGTYVQFIVGTDSSAIADPLEYFGDLETANGVVDTALEVAECTTWLNNGANPADISGDLNQLTYNSTLTFTGELVTAAGHVYFEYTDPPWSGAAPVIVPGMGMDLLAVRVWNVSKEDLEAFCTVPLTEVWYTTDREFGTVGSPTYPVPDTGWSVGMGSVPDGANPVDYDWGFTGTIGVEVSYGKPKNMTDVFLLECPIPEPGTMLLIGSSALLLLLRRKK